MNKLWIALATVASLFTSTVRAEAPGDNGPVEQTADVLLIGIPLFAYGLTFLLPQESDAEGKALGFDFIRMTGAPRHDLGLALMRTGAATYALKYAVDSERPNGKDGSFPSSHTSMTFAGAEFVRNRYGWGWGAPAYLAASYVGWSRVDTGHHYWRDVAAGAAIGILSNHDLHEFKTTWGSLRVAPTLLETRAFDPRVSEEMIRTSDAALGMNFELRF